MPTTWWVATTGSNTTGDGSQGNPYATAQKAHDVGAAGDTINVAAGTYASTLAVTKNNITVNGYGGMPVFYGATAVGGAAWALDSGNVWKKTGVTMAAGTGSVITSQSLIFVNLDGTITKGWQMDAKVEVDSTSTVGRKFFYDSVGTTLYVYSTSDPTTAFTAVHQTQTRGVAGTETGTYGGILDNQSTGLTLNNIAVRGWWGSGFLGYKNTTFTANGCDFSYNSEDGAGGHGGTNPIVNRCSMSWNGARRMRDKVAFSDINTDGDGWSWHATVSVPGTETTGAQDNYCSYVGNCKDAFQHINASTSTSTGAFISACNLNVVYNITGGTQTIKNARVYASSACISGIGFSKPAGTVNVLGCTFYGALVASTPCFRLLVGGPNTVGDCIVTNWSDVSTGAITEDYNCFGGNTAVTITPAAHSITTSPKVDANLGIPRSSPCWKTGVDLSGSGLTTDAKGRTRTTTPSMGAMEPYSAAAHGAYLAFAVE